MANLGTIDQVTAQYVEQQTSWGDSICTDTQRDQVEARWFAHARTIGMPNDARSFRRLFVQICIFAANIGTGSKEYWNGKNIDFTDHNNAARQVLAQDIWDRVIGDPNNIGAGAGFPVTVKAYFRNRAAYALAIFKAHPDQLKRSTRMGLPKAFAYLAADFFDGAKGLSSDEQGAIDAAKQLLLYRSNTTKVLNTANVYTGAQSSTSSGSVQTNAKQITFK